MRLPATIRDSAAALIGRVPVRIRGGPNAGLRWSAASSGRGIAAGRFEQARVDAFLTLIREGDTIWDVGAHKGYLSLAAARRAGERGRVIAFEPAPSNLRFLRRHVQWNRMTTIDIIPAALSDADGESRFGGDGSSVTFRLDRGTDVVRTRTIASLLREGLSVPDIMKIDVEGAEGAVLRGAGGALPDSVILCIAIHSREQYEKCTEWLRQREFAVIESDSMQAMMRRMPDGWSADPDLLAIGPARLDDTAGERWKRP